VQQLTSFNTANAGFAHEYQFIDVPDWDGVGESEPTPYFYQNLGTHLPLTVCRLRRHRVSPSAALSASKPFSPPCSQGHSALAWLGRAARLSRSDGVGDQGDSGERINHVRVGVATVSETKEILERESTTSVLG
jgi:hypothetical protein